MQFYVGKSDTNGTSSDTYVLNENTLNISGKFENSKVKSVALTPDGTTYTAKNESADTKGADSTYTRGFHLAGVDIPYPAGDYVQKTGTTSLSDSAALCWVQRCTAEGKVAWVLSLVNGSCPATKTNISCGGSEEEPEGNCSDASYKLTHKSECCPDTAYTDTACWVYTDPCKNYTASTYKWSKQEDRSSSVGWNTGAGIKECSVAGNRVTCPDADSSGVNIPNEENVARYFAEKASSLSSCSSTTVYEDQPCNNDQPCIKVRGSNNLNTLWYSGSGSGSVSWNKYICELESCTQAPTYLPNGWSW